MDVLKQDHPEIIAKYAKQKNLFRVHRFRWCKPFLKGINKIAYAICYHSLAYVRKSKRVMRELKTKGRRYKYGIALPKDIEDAMYVLDKEEGNQLWKESIKLERDAFEEAKVFRFLPPGARAPKGYKRIPVFMIFDIKQDLRTKSRFVAGGHVTGPPIAERYASVVRTENVLLIFLLAEINNLDILTGDIGNAYLNAYTNEKVYAIAGPEFGSRAGQIMIIEKAMYGLKTSANRWHAHLSDTLRNLGFVPSYSDENIWMKE